jgi:hypothetical protein
MAISNEIAPASSRLVGQMAFRNSLKTGNFGKFNERASVLQFHRP